MWLMLFLLAIVWGGGWLIWTNFREPIVTGILYVRQAEMAVAGLWTDNDTTYDVWLNRYDDKTEAQKKAEKDDPNKPPEDPEAQTDYLYKAKFGDWPEFTRTVENEKVTDNHLKILATTALEPMRYIFLALFGVLFLWSVFKGPTSYFRRKLSLEGLIGQQSQVFPVIAPFVKFNPSKLPFRPLGSPVPSQLPPFSEALSPEEWVSFHSIPMTGGLPDPEAAQAALAHQLGPRWRGAMALSAELQVLLAAFCLKAARKRDESDNMLGRLAMCWDATAGLKLRRDSGLIGEARKILRSKDMAEKTLANCSRHAFVGTAMIRALNTAREEGGVLAPAQFVWLRAHNRSLWYALNNLGRQAFHAEALGVMSHYRAEKQINRPIPKPRLTQAVEGLNGHLQNPIISRPIPELKKSDGKGK